MTAFSSACADEKNEISEVEPASIVMPALYRGWKVSVGHED
jgi:hypothetical protein